MEPIIRPAVSEDYEAICNLLLQVDQLHSTVYPDIFRPVLDGLSRQRDWFDSTLNDPLALLLVAEQDGQICGEVYAKLQTSRDMPILVPRTFVVVDELAVDTRMHRSGIGRVLMTAVEEWGRARGATTLELSVYTFNQAAIAFYERIGFGEVSKKMRRVL